MKYIPIMLFIDIVIIFIVFLPKTGAKIWIKLTFVFECIGVFFPILWIVVVINYFLHISFVNTIVLWIIDHTVNPPINYINYLTGTELPNITKNNSIEGALILLGKSLVIAGISFVIRRLTLRKKAPV